MYVILYLNVMAVLVVIQCKVIKFWTHCDLLYMGDTDKQ